ncbi:MAG: hypothetical protein HQL46_11845 [Gammaproteobacteria bacterium]|nr:hypothetical protein [Gammaproteobacteria bacterium]
MLLTKLVQWNVMSRLFLAMFLIFIAACSSTSESESDDKSSILSEPKSKINLFDSNKFDLNLGQALDAQLPEVEVVVTAPFTTNQIPERIDKWLSAVSKNDGDVDVVAIDEATKKPKERGLFVVVDVIKLALGIYDGAKNLARLNTTENYNAKLYYRPEDGVVTKIVFSLKNKTD